MRGELKPPVSIFVALLRGVNVGGKNMISMSSLKGSFERMGFRDVGTYINSGNILFKAKESDARKLEKKIERMLSREYTLECKVVVRSYSEMANLVENLPTDWIGDNPFAEAFNSRDIESLLSLYEPEALLIPRPGQVAEGVEAIRAALQELLALNGFMRSENRYALVHGDMALLRAEVHLVGTTLDGGRLEIHNHTAEVVRRQPDGRWLYIIDHPYGADPLDDSAA